MFFLTSILHSSPKFSKQCLQENTYFSLDNQYLSLFLTCSPLFPEPLSNHNFRFNQAKELFSFL